MTRRGLFLFAAMCVIWGIPYLLIRIAVDELSPAMLVFLRTGVGALILMPVVIARGGLRGIGARWVPLVAFAAAEVGIPWLMLATAEQKLPSSLAGLLISAVPLVATVIAPLFGNRDWIGATGVVGLLVGMAGVAAIVGFDLRASAPLALVEMGVVAIGYAVGPAILSRYLTGMPSVSVIGISLTLCALVYAPAAIVQWPHAVPSVSVLASVATLAVVCTAIAFLLFFALIAEIGPVRATVITYINPAVAAALGVTVLRESFTFGMALGFVLVIAGSVLATRRRPRPASAPERTAEPTSV
ncbi:MAG TPA: DMT family transporter [Candidatus Dormibacteraeota bacterium]|nr:DMT family transporter [Candidatus Dormibacteraeota bacterium]